MTKSVILTGVGHAWTSGGTMIYLGANSNCDVIVIDSGDDEGNHMFFPTIRDLYIYGRKDGQTVECHGIHILSNVSDVKIQDVGISHCNGHGIYTKYGWLHSYRDAWLEYNNLSGIRIDDGQPKLTNVHSSWNTGSGINIVGGKTILTASTISNNGGHGIRIAGAGDSIINGNRIYSNSHYSPGTYCGVLVFSTSYCNIVNNIFDGDARQQYGVRIFSSASNITVAENQFYDHTMGGVLSTSIDNIKICGNSGYVTENAGTATLAATATSTNVEHGLDDTPTCVQVTPASNPATKQYWISDKGSSSFTITSDSPHTDDIVFYWGATV